MVALRSVCEMISGDDVRVACSSTVKRLKAMVKDRGDYFENSFNMMCRGIFQQ